MHCLHSTEISVHYLSWINQELRKNVEERAVVPAKRTVVMSRVKNYFVAGLSAVSLVALKLLDI